MCVCVCVCIPLPQKVVRRNAELNTEKNLSYLTLIYSKLSQNISLGRLGFILNFFLYKLILNYFVHFNSNIPIISYAEKNCGFTPFVSL